MGIFNSDGLTHNGYGGKPYLTQFAAMESRLSGIGQTTHGGITGSTAIDAVKRYAATGASEADVMRFAQEIARKHGR